MDGVIHRAGGAGEVEDVIDVADVERFADVFIYEIESRIVTEMSDVPAASGEQVVDDNHTVALAEQGIAEMGSQKTGAAGDQSAWLIHLPELMLSWCRSEGRFLARQWERPRDARRRVPRNSK